MAHAEFIQSWNGMFMFKLKETDLKSPSEIFLFNTLLEYLKQFNIDMSSYKNLYHENVETRFQKKILFCQYIDHLYRISDKSHSFVYFDLIRPLPKKTVHMLKILQNYLLYFNMVKEIVLENANQLIFQRDDLSAQIDNIVVENEKNTIRSEMIKTKIEELNELIPRLREKVIQLTTERNNKTDRLTTFEGELDGCEIVFNNDEQTLKDLRSKVIDQAEIDNILSQKENIKATIQQQLDAEREASEYNTVQTATTGELKPCDDRIATILDTYSLDIEKSTTTIKAEVDKITAEMRYQKDANTGYATKLATMKGKIEEQEATLKQIAMIIQKENQKYAELLASLTEDHARLINSDQLDDELKKQNEILSEVVTDRELMENITTVVVKFIGIPKYV